MLQLKKKTLEVSVWDYDKCSSNDFLGEVKPHVEKHDHWTIHLICCGYASIICFGSPLGPYRFIQYSPARQCATMAPSERAE